ncbi:MULTISPECIES: tyrosine-protein phosphatase [Sphingobium]|jgi:protein-tyrosine phosphatase|uniref:tyrosine-protein phosphatase n=1 Tax=Sphingobium TaxID=165695 RepID=UPI000DBB7118|nr:MULTISPECIES: tyrosine-protein phosphatase [Sphingobium]KAA9014789.1 tyrosine-protein phosphatase [Sphingobium limneticum]MBU0930832.1 tyrosine-protein phosphatase [Alphaproteobacteria bacterium]BBD01033.1 protein-tyrosine phosphatase [Sphingobium sp. YG1]
MSETVIERSGLPLASAFNLRDFGGYPTADGRMIRRGMLYRSGTMALLTPEDSAQLRSLGIRAICDFRRPGERKSEPTSWHDASVDYYCRDYSGATGVLVDMVRQERTTAADMKAAMLAVYHEIATDHAEAYAAMFRQMLEGHLPILINCSAGKDRTGAGAAMVLAALGVSRDVIVEDYLLTNSHADWTWRLAQGESHLSRLKQARADVLEPLLVADVAYLQALFNHFDTLHGGVDGYLRDVLGVGASEQAALREALLIP